MVYTMTNQQEIAAPLASLYILRGSACYKSHSCDTLSLNQVLRQLCEDQDHSCTMVRPDQQLHKTTRSFLSRFWTTTFSGMMRSRATHFTSSKCGAFEDASLQTAVVIGTSNLNTGFKRHIRSVCIVSRSFQSSRGRNFRRHLLTTRLKFTSAMERSHLCSSNHFDKSPILSKTIAASTCGAMPLKTGRPIEANV